MKILLTILLLLLPLQVMAQTRLERIIESGTKNYSSKPNREFINALYREFHNRDAVEGEYKRFRDMSIQDTSNIIAGHVIIIPPISKKKEIVKEQVKDNIKRYNNIVNIYGNPTDGQRDFIKDYSTRVKLKKPINVTVADKIPDEFINNIDGNKKDWINRQGQSVAGAYGWGDNNIFVSPKFSNDFNKDYQHELGHAIDDQYDINATQFPKYFGQTIRDFNTNPLDPNFQQENVANHIRDYMRIPDIYVSRYPDNAKYLDSILKIPDGFITSK